MKKILMFVLCLFPLTAFPVSSGGDHPVFLNGKPFSTAVTINGTLAIPLEDLSKGAGSNVSLEPAFQLRGNGLNAQMGWDVKKNQKAVAYKSSSLLFRVNRSGSISNRILTLNGKPFANAVVIQGGILAIPLEEFAKAVGAAVTLEPTLTLQGNRLSVREAASVALKYKEAGAPEKKIVQPNASAKIKLAPGQI